MNLLLMGFELIPYPLGRSTAGYSVISDVC